TTRQIHSEGHGKPKNAHVMPIFQSSTFVFDSPEHGAALFANEVEGHIYTRLGNPTTEALERTLANLENAEQAVVVSSGMAAVEACILPFVEAGDHIISGDTLYGPCLHLIGDIFSKWGIASSFVDTSDPDKIAKAITPKTKICFFETPANPTNKITDIAAVAEICHKKGIRVIIDNTFATPYNQRPLEHGCDIVMHSATKYLNGHGDVIGGCVIGNSEDMALVKKFRTDTGPCMSPFDSFLFLRGLKTLSLRMERHNSNGLRIAQFLENHPDVKMVSYPGLPSCPGYKVAKKQMSGFGGMIAFELKGGFEAAKELLKNIDLCTLAVSLGTLDTLIQHPASMTHAKVPKNLREQQSLTDDLVRISVGCEDVEDLIADLDSALEKTRKKIGVAR
ncbi:MAG: PLP-dependent aspartate aminotransferase family protein, partial [bacterium]